MPWVCPACNRQFGRRGQSHTCAPATPIDEYFADRSPELRAIYDAVAAHLEGLGPLTIDAVSVGILFKRATTFAELRPRRSGFMLSLLMSRNVEHPRISRSLATSGRRAAIFIPLPIADDVDDEVRGWLTESYESAPG